MAQKVEVELELKYKVKQLRSTPETIDKTFTIDDIKNDVIFVHKLKNSNISLIEDKNVSINNLLYNLSLN